MRCDPYGCGVIADDVDPPACLGRVAEEDAVRAWRLVLRVGHEERAAMGARLADHRVHVQTPVVGSS